MAQFEACVGQTLRVLVEGEGKLKNGILSGREGREGDCVLMGRTEHGMVTDFFGPRELIGQFVDVRITEASNWALAGERI